MAAPGRDAGLPRIIIADAKAIDHLNLYVAKELGLFKKHGIDVTIVEARDQSSARELVVSGQADLFWSCPSVAIATIASGAPIRIVAQVKTPCSSRLFLPKGSVVKTVADLKGKRVAGISPTCEGVLAYQRQVRQTGGRFIVEVSGGARAVADLAAGSIAGAILEEPHASIAEAKGFPSLPQAGAAAMPCRTINARTGILRDNPDAVKRLVAALVEANALIRKDPANARILTIAENYTATARPVLQRAMKRFRFTEQVDEKGLATLTSELLAAQAIRENPQERLFAQELKGITWGR
jgi:NitT/TauT family transport system substrate-binding protein